MDTRAAGDALVFDDEVTGNLAVESLQLERQVFVTQLLLERRVGAAGFAHHQAQYPEEKTKFHAHGLGVIIEWPQQCNELPKERHRSRALAGDRLAFTAYSNNLLIR